MDCAVIELRGGMANQLFQWAYAEALVSGGTAETYVLDARDVTRPHCKGIQIDWVSPMQTLLPSPVATRLWRASDRAFPSATRRLGPRVPVISPRWFHRHVLPLASTKSVTWVRGYLQDPLPLIPHRKELTEAIRSGLRASLSHTEQEQIAALGRFLVAHVRRGDYVTNASNLARIGVATVSYYASALSMMKADYQRLVIVSDDPEFAEENIAPLWEGDVHVSRSGSALVDLATITAADGAILANSTYSWWGAFAGVARRVVCPALWFDEDPRSSRLTLSDWVPLDKYTGRA